MRRREKFVISSIFLSVGLLALQQIPLEFRYYGVAIFGVISYLVSTWALSDDLQPFERLTVVPFPTLYAIAVSLFYFLLPESILSKAMILGLFAVGMYALYLTCNIYSVAKGRTIQLIHAAHAVGLLFTLLTSLIFSNTIFSLKLPFFMNGALLALVNYPLVFISLWSVRLEEEVSERLGIIAGLVTLILAELGIALSFYPLSVWHNSLFIMSFLYIALGVLHNYLKGRLFSRTITEYTLVAIFVGIIFTVIFPVK